MSGLIWIKGAGDLATGVAWRLRMAGFPVVMTELPQPLCVRRAVSFAEAVWEERQTVEGVQAVLVQTPAEVARAISRGEVPVVVDPGALFGRRLRPAVLIDAVMAKRNTGTRLADAPVVIALGPGFTVGEDCHAVIETNRGHYLGRALYRGAAAPDTGVPGEVAGVREGRVVRAPASGLFSGTVGIGAVVAAGERLGEILPEEILPEEILPAGGQTAEVRSPVPVLATIGGAVRGLIRSGTTVSENIKIGDIDPTGEVERCFTISEKALAVAGGALEAVLRLTGGAGRSVGLYGKP